MREKSRENYLTLAKYPNDISIILLIFSVMNEFYITFRHIFI